MLRQLSREKETDGCLDLSRRNCVPAVLLAELACFGCDPLENIVDEGVHDAHRFAGDSDIGMHLLEDVVDVEAVTLLSLLLPLFVARSTNLSTLLSGALFALLGHFDGFGCSNCVRHVE